MQMSRFFQKCITDDYMVHKGAKLFMKRICITFYHGKNKLSFYLAIVNLPFGRIKNPEITVLSSVKVSFKISPFDWSNNQ